MRGRKPQADAVRRGLTDALTPSPTQAARFGVSMPSDIAGDPLQREIWSWVVPEFNHFTEQDLPQLRELVTWHAVFESAREAIMAGDGSGSMEVFGDNGRKHPAITVMKEASSEIRALSDHLGLSPLARSRLGLMQTTAVKTAAETAAMFMDMEGVFPEIDAAYPELKTLE